MPIENERKYVLDLSSSDKLELCLKNLDCKKIQISQYYLDQNNRLRCCKNINEIYYEFCFKKNILGNVVEIQTAIDLSDFNLLKSDCNSKIIKDRYYLNDRDYCWEIDFIKDINNQTCFCLAEIELGIDELWPKYLPALIQPYIIKIVDPTDNSFTNRKLSKPGYIKKIMSKLHEDNKTNRKIVAA